MTEPFATRARHAPDALAAQLEAAVRAGLGAPVHVAVRAADTRHDEHRLGRAALAEALTAAGRAPEAPATWPCAYASVSHSHGVAIAVVVAAGAASRGLGVDLELDRPVKPGLAGVFCDARERAWLDAQPAAGRDGDVLRLWTAKEALYKADPAQGDAIVAEYAVAVPGLDHGRRGRGRARLISLRVGDAALSVALHEPKDEED